MKLETNTVAELKAMAKAQGLTGYSKLTKAELIQRLERAMGKAPKSTVIKEIAKEQGIPVVDVPMTQVSDWEDMQGVPTISEEVDSAKPVQITSPLSSDEVWEESTKITEEVLEQPAGSMRVMNRHARRRAKAILRKKMRRAA